MNSFAAVIAAVVRKKAGVLLLPCCEKTFYTQTGCAYAQVRDYMPRSYYLPSFKPQLRLMRYGWSAVQREDQMP